MASKGKKRGRKRAGSIAIKTGARAVENRIRRKAEFLRYHPEVLIPEGCERFFVSIKKAVDRVQEAADDPEALKKLSKKGDKLARAYASTLLVLEKESSPTLAVVHFPHGEASVVYNPHTPKEKLVGVQYYDSPVFRIYAIKDVAEKKRVFVFSLDDKMVCTGREFSVPDGFVEDVVAEARLSVQKLGPGMYACPHMVFNSDGGAGPRKEMSGGREPVGAHMHVFLGDARIFVCQRCAKGNRNLSMLLLRRIAGPKVERFLEVRGSNGLVCGEKRAGGKRCDSCLAEKGVAFGKRYLAGRETDEDALTRALEEEKRLLVENGLFVVDGVCYKKMRSLAENVEGDVLEKKALLGIAEIVENRGEGFFVSGGAGGVLSALWAEVGGEAIKSVLEDASLADEVVERVFSPDLGSHGPVHLLRRAVEEEKNIRLLSSLPSYSDMGPIGRLADRLARAYRVGGKEGLIKRLHDERLSTTKEKSLSYAFFLAVGEEGGGWRYTETERDFARYLSDFARELLEADAGDYHDALCRLVQAVGSGEPMPVKARGGGNDASDASDTGD